MRSLWGNLLLTVGALFIGVSVTFFVSNEEKRRAVEGTYENLRETYFDTCDKEDFKEQKTAGQPKERLPAVTETVLPDLPKKEEPDIDWQGLNQWNPSVKAWLEIPGISLNYPIVQGEDNEYYLHHSIEGEPSDYGAIFLGWEHSSDFSDAESFIYGHNMQDGEMFALLNQYENPEFYQENPVFYIYTPELIRMYHIFSVQQARVGGREFSYEYALGTEEYLRQLEYLKETSLYPIGSTLDAGSPVAALVTCNTGLQDDRRMVVYGILCEVSLTPRSG